MKKNELKKSMILKCGHIFSENYLRKQIITPSNEYSTCIICKRLINSNIIIKLKCNAELSLKNKWLYIKRKIKKYSILNVLLDLKFKNYFKFNIFNHYSIKQLLRIYSYATLDKAIWTLRYIINDMIKYHYK